MSKLLILIVVFAAILFAWLRRSRAPKQDASPVPSASAQLPATSQASTRPRATTNAF